jgi:hypothetical protein
MDDAQIAGLRRKYAATDEPAKRGEIRNLLLLAGVDPDAKPVKAAAPEGRTAPVKVTAKDSRPVAKTAVAPPAPEPNETSKETADKPSVSRRRPARSAKPETTK